MEYEIINELKEIYPDSNYSCLTQIQSKDGICVYRVKVDERSVVIKHFKSEEFKREIANYELLKLIGVPTIRVLGKTDNCICLEDIDTSNIYRLGVADDLNDEYIIRSVAKWYKCLHSKGDNLKGLSTLYRESDLITYHNIEMLNSKIRNEVWDLIINKINLIHEIINNLKETIVYNDFYWTNLVVSKNRKDALMFDYNLLGRGYRYSDIRNVCSVLTETSKSIFLREYGDFDKNEIIIDKCISPVITLIFAFMKDEFPEWGNESIDAVRSGELCKRIKEIIKVYK